MIMDAAFRAAGRPRGEGDQGDVVAAGLDRREAGRDRLQPLLEPAAAGVAIDR